METIGTGDLRRAIGHVSFERGLDYFERGMVRSVEFETPCRIHGRVSGRRSNLYSVLAVVALRADGRLLSIEGHCSCPVGFNCKHVAAVLLAAQEFSTDGSSRGSGRAREPVSGEVRQWLNRWPEPAAGRANNRPAGPPARSREHLFYVVHRDAMRRANVTPYRAYLRKDGTIGTNFREFHERNHSRTHRYVTVEDASILGKFGFYSDDGYPRHYDWPDGEDLIGLIREIVDSGRARAGDIRGAALSWGEPRRCELAWSVGESGEQHVVARDGAGSLVTLLPFPTPFFVDPESGEIGVAETALPPRMASWFAAAPPVRHGSVDAVVAKLSRIGQHAPVPRLHRVEERSGARPVPVLTLYGCTYRLPRYVYGNHRGSTRDAASVIYPCARLEIAYDGASAAVRAGRGDDVAASGQDGFAVIRRDRAREAAFEKALRDAAKRYGYEDHELLRYDHALPSELREADIVFPPVGDEDDAASGAGIGFASQAVPQLRAEGWRVEIEGTWPFRLYEGPVAFSTSLETRGSDWFSLCLSLEANGRALDIAPIVLQLVDALPVDDWGGLQEDFDVERHLAGRVFHSRFEDGTWLAIDAARFTRFAEAFLEAQGLLGFHRAEAGRLFELAEALEGCGAPWTGGREILDLGARLRSLAEAPEVPAPAALRGELRPYQRAGYGWLRALSDSGFGGVLADDMGLGKTVQTLALLAHRHLEEKAGRPSLLVVPTSLVGNWRREATRFVPDLKLLVLHGPDRRERFPEIPHHHLVVTTYPLLNRDHEVLFCHDYDIAVLDEAQAVKNPAAAVSKRIREIRARQRLALTGTPMENNLQELWALYDWLIPGLLGNRKTFTADFRNPIEKRGDRARQRLLSTRVKPFLMRRTKEQVARELPEKTVIDELIPLEGAQAALYESIRTAMDTRIREAIAARGLAASRIAILDALLKLRQVCCDPRLVRLDAARKVGESAKRARLLALLEELVAEGRKVLVFSQFVKMLKLVERDVTARGWGYAMLHGGTKDRDAQVANFQSGDLSLFLISLKAGGTGLNLTAADTVIVCDPWWNPAVERQAMDRAHRIGQDKPVFVHRLIAENTVEAAIQRMQARKQALADAFFEGTGQGPLTLMEEDIHALFGAG